MYLQPASITVTGVPFGTDAVVCLSQSSCSQSKKKKNNDDAAHLSGLKADGFEGSKSQVAPVGELSEPTDDARKQTEKTLLMYITITIRSAPFMLLFSWRIMSHYYWNRLKWQLMVQHSAANTGWNLLLQLTVSPSCTGLPVGGVQSGERRHKVATVRRTGCCCQRLWK